VTTLACFEGLPLGGGTAVTRSRATERPRIASSRNTGGYTESAVYRGLA
jgi:hypothetical protein